MKTRYTEDHEWITQQDDGEFTIGITNYAQQQLGDIVYVELPDIDSEFQKGDEMIVVESVKSAGEIKAPMHGVVIAVNEVLEDQPELINESAEQAGWLCRIKCTDDRDFRSLMSADDYQSLLDSLS